MKPLLRGKSNSQHIHGFTSSSCAIQCLCQCILPPLKHGRDRLAIGGDVDPSLEGEHCTRHDVHCLRKGDLLWLRSLSGADFSLDIDESAFDIPDHCDTLRRRFAFV